MSNPLPITDPDSTVNIPAFKDNHIDARNGRTYSVKKVPQTSFLEITASGKGDLPDRLKGRFTGTLAAERAVRNHLQVQRQEMEREGEEAVPSVDMFTKDENLYTSKEGITDNKGDDRAHIAEHGTRKVTQGTKIPDSKDKPKN